MTREHIKSLAEHLSKQSDLFEHMDYSHISVLLSKEEIEYIVKQLREHAEPTHEEVKEYCKARELSLITNSLLDELISRK